MDGGQAMFKQGKDSIYHAESGEEEDRNSLEELHRGAG
jgi:hypothetical protein